LIGKFLCTGQASGFYVTFCNDKLYIFLPLVTHRDVVH